MNRQQCRRVAALEPRVQPGVRPSSDIDLVWSLATQAASEGKDDRDAPFTHGVDTSLLGYGILTVATQSRPVFGWNGSLHSAS